MASSNIDDIIENFKSFTHKPVNYLTVQTEVREDIKSLVKSIYDHTKSEEQSDKKTKQNALSKLIIEDFDEEQIWQEIDLQNTERWDQLVWEVANCMSSKNDLVFPVKVATGKKDNKADKSEVALGDEELDMGKEKPKKNKTKSKKDLARAAKNNAADYEHLESESPRKNQKSKPNPGKASIVDDEFFKLSEMEKFLLDEEKKEGKTTAPDSDDESPELFGDVDDDDDEEKDVMYNDFFGNEENNEYYVNDERDYGEFNDEDEMEEDFFNDSRMVEKGDNEHSDNDDDDDDDEDIEKKSENEQANIKAKKKKVTFADGSSDEDFDDSSDDENTVTKDKQSKEDKKSEFELRQQRLQQTITRLEDKNINEAPWQLKGEVDATKRPQNSLLQEVVDFDLTSRPAPIITEQTTITLEEIIRRRVKDKAWDDVIRKEKPVDNQLSFRKTEIIDQSKSKLSLAQVYEAEYLKQKQAASGDVEDENEPESHTKIRDSMKKLFSKLDALCHYHYTPKAPQAEVKIVSNTPAISMEEVAPVATSEAALLAPEEVKKKQRGDLMSKEERTQTDKNRERRKKKKLQRKKGQVTKVTDNRNTKQANETSDKSLKTSKAFFQQLNDDSNSLMKNKRNVKNKGQ